MTAITTPLQPKGREIMLEWLMDEVEGVPTKLLTYEDRVTPLRSWRPSTPSYPNKVRITEADLKLG